MISCDITISQLRTLQSKGCGKCIINKSAPFPWLKGSTCFNYPVVIWTRSTLRSVTQIFHQRGSEINTALCVQGAVRGQGETQSDSVFVFPSVWVSPYLSCMAHVVEQKDSVCWQVWTCVYLISYSSADIKGSEDKKNLFTLIWIKYLKEIGAEKEALLLMI